MLSTREPLLEKVLNSEEEALERGTVLLAGASKGLSESTNSPKPVTTTHKTNNGFSDKLLLFPPPYLIFPRKGCEQSKAKATFHFAHE